MPLSSIQKIVFRHAIRYSKILRKNNEILMFQPAPQKASFQKFSLIDSTKLNEEVLKAVYPTKLHELIVTYPNRHIDSVELNNIVKSAFRSKLKEVEDNSKHIDDLALEGHRALSLQVLFFKSYY